MLDNSVQNGPTKNLSFARASYKQNSNNSFRAFLNESATTSKTYKH